MLRRLDRFGHPVALVVVALAIAIGIGGLLVEGPGRFYEVVLFAVALARAAAPSRTLSRQAMGATRIA